MKNTLESLQKTKEIVDVDIGKISPETRPSWLMAKANAKKKYRDLEQFYVNELLQNLTPVGVKVSSDKANDFISALRDNGKFVLNVNELYEVLARPLEDIFKTTNRRTFSLSHSLDLLGRMRTLSLNLGYIYNINPRFTGEVQLNNAQEVLDFVKKTVRNLLNDDFNKVYLKDKILELGLINQISEPNTIFLVKATEEELNSVALIFEKKMDIIDSDQLNLNLKSNENLIAEPTQTEPENNTVTKTLETEAKVTKSLKKTKTQ